MTNHWAKRQTFQVLSQVVLIRPPKCWMPPYLLCHQGKEIQYAKLLVLQLSDLIIRWRNWVIRGIFTWVMIFGFALMIYAGPLALMLVVIFNGIFHYQFPKLIQLFLQVLAVQVKCFAEIINIGYAVYKIHGLPWFRSLSWYFLITSNYFFYGESLVDYFGVVDNRTVKNN